VVFVDALAQDSNLATHLIRNAVAGSSKTLLKTLLSLPGKLARNYRDDVSIFWSLVRPR